ncbi:hypothetical protein TNCV_3656041 [Trichonephila clavipes]|nr:hypothetical protein TNCV_3656041 [Trichonephila clavipes]
MLAIPRSEPVSFDSPSMTHVNSGIPLVRSITIYRISQALELKAILAPPNDINLNMIQTIPRKGKQIPPIPVVYSFILLKMCEALDLIVELHPENERPAFNNNCGSFSRVFLYLPSTTTQCTASKKLRQI